MLKRMTDYTLAQLIEASKKKSGPSCGGYHGVHSCCGALITPVAKIPADELPIGAIMNEIGTIFLNDGTPEAEDALAKLFDNVDEPIIASVAYFYFSQKMDALKPGETSMCLNFCIPRSVVRKSYETYPIRAPSGMPISSRFGPRLRVKASPMMPLNALKKMCLKVLFISTLLVAFYISINIELA